MAGSSFGLFMNQVSKATPALQVKALQIVFDMLTMYERDLLTERPTAEQVSLQP